MEHEWTVGIDRGSEAHQVCVIDSERQVIGERVVEHRSEALAELARWLLELAGGEPERLAVAIEVPRGAVVETLLEHGFPVYSLNPKQLDRFRDRHTVAGAKDDRRDAFVLADALRTDRPLFRKVEADDPLVIQIRELSRVDDDLREEENRLQNRLRAALRRTQPHLLDLSPSVDEPWFWELLERVIVSETQRRPNRSWIGRLLGRHHIRRLDVEEVFEGLKDNPLHVAPGTREAVRTHVELLLPRLELVRSQRKQCKKDLSRLLDEYGRRRERGRGAWHGPHPPLAPGRGAWRSHHPAC